MRIAGLIIVTLVVIGLFIATGGIEDTTSPQQEPSAPVQGSPSDSDLKGLKID